MTVPIFDESISAEKLPMEVFRWLKEATIFLRTSPENAEEVYDTLKLLLRLLAVRNPDSQSHATRQALGCLIESFYMQPNCDKILLDLVGLFIRMIDAKNSHKFNAMKHLAIAGLGSLAKYMSTNMRQMAANVFIICLESLKICPIEEETKRYRNTILWTMAQAATSTVDETSIKSGMKAAKSMIENASTDEVDVTTIIRSFNLLTSLVALPATKALVKKLDSFHSLYTNYGVSSPHREIREAAASFYCAALVALSPHDYRHNITNIVKSILKIQASSRFGVDVMIGSKFDTSCLLLEKLLKYDECIQDFASQFDDWIAPLLLELSPLDSVRFVVNGLLQQGLHNSHAGTDMVAVLLRQLALSRAQTSQKSSASKAKNMLSTKPLTESTLACLTEMVTVMGSAIQPFATSIHQATLGLILNGSEPLSDEQLGWCVLCLLAVVRNSPQLLAPTIEDGLKQLETPATNSKRVEIAYVVGSMVSESKNMPLYGNLALNSRIIHLGVENIRRRDDFLSYKVGWVLICSILSLDSDAVKPLVSQLLLLWESHLSPESCQFSEYVERSLSGLAVFLYHNKKLLTADVTRRIGNLLYSVWSVVEGLSPDALLRCRLLQCYDQLLQAGRLELYPSSLLMKFVAHTTIPDSYSKETGVTIQSAMLSSSKPKGKLQGIINPRSSSTILFQTLNAIESGVISLKYDTRASVANDLDFILFRSDPYDGKKTWNEFLPRDVYTTAVDLAVSVVSKLLPLQPLRIQESVFDAILANLENTSGPQTLRRTAVLFNVSQLIHETLRKGVPVEDRILRVTISIIKFLLGAPIKEIREQAASCCGILINALKNDPRGANALGLLIKELLELSISTQCEPCLRFGSILALGYIAQGYTQYSILEPVFKVLMQLSTDPNSEIHLPAVRSLRKSLVTAESVDQKYVKCTLKTLTLTYLLESHNNSTKFQLEVAEGLHQVLSRFGPLLSTEHNESNRNLIICFADQLQSNDDYRVRVLAWKCFIEVYYYARQGIAWSLLIKKWGEIIIDSHSLTAEIDAAVNGLLILMKLSARSIISIAGNGFEDALWLLLDKYPENRELRAVLKTWLDQTTDIESSKAHWIQTLSTVVTKPRYFFLSRLDDSVKGKNSIKSKSERSAAVNPTAVAADEDVALEVQTDESSNELLSWECRSFALELLLRLVRQDLDGKNDEEKTATVTTRMVGDIIKVSFLSSTSQILGLQFMGLALLNEIITQLSHLTDPDFPQISYLAQYQVQIVSALSSAFSSESSPGLALTALHVCSTFITSNIIQTREKLAKLLKILEEPLECMRHNKFKLGSLRTSIDASRVLQIGVLAVWAEILNNTTSKPHLESFVASHKDQLASLWTEAIYELGKMNSALESQWSSSTLSAAIDQMVETQQKSLVKPIFDTKWLSFVCALSNIESEDSGFRLVLCGLCLQVLLEMLQKSSFSITPLSEGFSDNSQDFEVAEYGISRSEAELSGYAGYSSMLFGSFFSQDRVSSVKKLSILEVMQKLLTASTCEKLMKPSDGYFDEILPILYRAMLVGSPDEQAAVLNISRALVTDQPETDESVDHFFEILKIAILPLRKMFPKLFDPNIAELEFPHNRRSHSEIKLLRNTLDTVIDIAQVFREVIQNDLWICVLKVFEELNHYEPVVVAPSFKRLLGILATQVEARGVTFVVGALTFSLQRAVKKESTVESLLTSAAITCTNYRSLYSPYALFHIRMFSKRASSALIEGTKEDSTESARSLAVTAMQCIIAVLRVCSDTPAGVEFAYTALPSLIKVVSNENLAKSEQGSILVRQCATALCIFGAIDGSYDTLSVVIPALISTREINLRPLLIHLMTKCPIEFKQCVWQMEQDDRNLLQTILAQPDDLETTHNSDIDEQDSDDGEIALKSFV